MGVNHPMEDEAPRSGVVTIWIVLAFSLLLGIGPLVTPSIPASVATGDFSVDRAMAHVERIATNPHPMGTPEIAEVRDYLVSELELLDLNPEFQAVTVPDYFGAPGNSVEIVNVMARISGSDHTKAVLVVGHYDTVPTTPGANDNSAAVGVMLEIGRVLVEREALANDVILLFSDGEEPAPRFGSGAFVSMHPWAADVGFVVNLEAVGGSGPSVVVEERGPGSWAIEGLVASAPSPVAFSYLTQIAELIGEVGTDFDSFEKPGNPGLHFAYMRNSPIYHTEADSIDNVSARSVAHHGSNTLGVVSHFGEVDLRDPPDAAERVFFTIVRSTVVSYPTSWALPLVLVAAVVLGGIIVANIRRDDLRVGAVLAGALRAFGGVLASIVVVTAVWWLITLLRSTPGAVEGYGYLAVLLALVTGVWLLLRQRSRVGHTSSEQMLAIVVVWLLFAAATALWLPGMSYLFTWPALAACFVMVVRAARGSISERAGEALFAVVTVTTLVLMVPPVDTIFQMAMPRPGNTDSQIVAVVGLSAFFGYLVIALVGATYRHIQAVLTE